jgi:hypothetical protein
MRLRAQQHTRVCLVEDRLVVPPIALGHIDSCAEGPITIGLDDRNVDVVVFSSAAPSGGDLAGHTFVKRIQLFWPAQRQSRDMTVHAESNCFEAAFPGHSLSSHRGKLHLFERGLRPGLRGRGRSDEGFCDCLAFYDIVCIDIVNLVL